MCLWFVLVFFSRNSLLCLHLFARARCDALLFCASKLFAWLNYWKLASHIDKYTQGLMRGGEIIMIIPLQSPSPQSPSGYVVIKLNRAFVCRNSSILTSFFDGFEGFWCWSEISFIHIWGTRFFFFILPIWLSLKLRYRSSESSVFVIRGLLIKAISHIFMGHSIKVH